MATNFDNAGINSLGGFVYQIDVFILNALKLKPEDIIEYESIEDVSIRKKEELDKKEDFFRTNITSSGSHKVIQVKKKNITNSTIEKVLMNWLFLEISDSNIEEYILWGDSSYHNFGDIKKIKIKDLFNKIRKTKDRSTKSLTKQLKNIFESNYKNFYKTTKKIMNKSKFIQSKPINERLLDEASALFHKDGVFDAVYIARIKSLRDRISSNILESIKNQKSFSLEYKVFRKMVEDITTKITDEFPLVSYTEHKKNNPIHLQDIENLREVQQLKHCRLNNSDIIRRMARCNYYQDYIYQLKNQAQISKIEDIETTAFENFEDIKEKLAHSGEDEPYKRLTQTEDKENSACQNEYIRKGVCIYLTKDIKITGDKQISWKDESND